jgi:anti-sigma factor RsiW
MNHDFDDELLSAYLDDELSVAERADVERLLAERPEARRLLEELRTLRDDLRMLPLLQLGGDFGANVLRHAERELLRPAPTNGTVTPARTGSGGPAVDDQGGRWRRPAAWSILAVAAAAVLMFFESRRGEERQVALHRADESSVGPATAAQKVLPPATPAPAKGMPTPAEQPAPGGQFVVSNSIPAGNAAVDGAVTLTSGATPSAKSGGRYAVVDGVPETKPTGTQVLNNLQIAGAAVESQSVAAAMPSKVGPPVAPVAVGAANAFGTQGVDTTPLVASNDFRRAQTLISEYSGMRRTAPDAKQATQLFSQRLQQRARDEQRLGDDRLAGLRAREVQPADDDRLLVVYCDVTPEALERGLPAMLQREQIADLTALQQGSAPASLGLGLGGGVGGGGANFGGGGFGGAMPAVGSDKRGDRKDLNSAASQEQFLYVVADGRRLESMLSSLRSEPQLFVNVEVEPAANGDQQAWRKYNRAAAVAQAKPKGSTSTPPTAIPATPPADAAPSAAVAAKPTVAAPAAAPVPGAAPAAPQAPLATRESAAGEKETPSAAADNPRKQADASSQLSKSASGGDRSTRGVEALPESAATATSVGGGVAQQPAAPGVGNMPQQQVTNWAYGGASGYGYSQQLALPLSRAQRLSSANVDALRRGSAGGKEEDGDAAAGAMPKAQSPSAPNPVLPPSKNLGDAPAAAAPIAAKPPVNEAKSGEPANRAETATSPSNGLRQNVTSPLAIAPGQSSDVPTPGEAAWYGLPADYHEALFIFRVVDGPAK